MGVVFRGFDTAIGRDVAIKIIRLDQFATANEKAELRLRFAREATAAGKLSHPNIVTVYHLGEQNDLQYLVLELVDGWSLEKALSNGIPQDRTLSASILSQVANALDYAHGKGIVHRDVKPANILVRRDGIVKLTDFGIARISSQTITKTGFSMGTPAYMAPEQIMSARVDGRADQFSLAVIAYQMLSGRRPFIADSDPGLIFRITSEEPQPLHELDRSFPPRTSDVLRKGLAKDPAQRFVGCAEFIRALSASFEQQLEATPAPIPGPLSGIPDGPDARRLRPALPGWAMALGAAALAITILLGVLVEGQRSTRSPRTTANTSAASSPTIAPSTKKQFDGPAEKVAPQKPIEVAASPVSTKAPGDTPQKSLNQETAVPLPGVYNDPHLPDSKDTLARLNRIWEFRAEGALESAPVVLGDIMYVSGRNAVYALDAGTGKEHWRIPLHRLQSDCLERSVAVAGTRVYFGTDAHLVAYDTIITNGSNGIGAKLLWNAELVPGAAHGCSGTPLVVKDKVVIGVGGRGVRASIDAYDAGTGKLVWRFYTIPAVGEVGSETWDHESTPSGGDALLGGSFDPYLNTIYWGTGPPGNRGGWAGDELFTSSVVALDADTGRLKWHFQFTPNDTPGWGAVQPPILVDADFQGRPRKLLVAANPNGFYYILDRATGQFLQGTPFVEQTWARLDGAGRPARQGSKQCPDVGGATRSSPSYDPHSGLAYLAARNGCSNGVPADREMHLRAIEATTGKVVWDYKQIGRWWSSGELATGEMVFAVEAQQILAMHDATTGKRLNAMTFANPILSGPMTYHVGDTQYIALTAGPQVIALGLR